MIDALGDRKDNEKHNRECNPRNSRHFLGDQIDAGDGKQQHCDYEQPDRDLFAAQIYIEWDFPLAMRFVLEAQHQHRHGVEGKRPDDPKGVRLAKVICVAARGDDRHYLQQHYQVDHSISRAIFLMRRPEPVGHHPVF